MTIVNLVDTDYLVLSTELAPGDIVLIEGQHCTVESIELGTTSLSGNSHVTINWRDGSETFTDDGTWFQLTWHPFASGELDTVDHALYREQILSGAR